jgi:23S rRNA pseudouridine2605 synthase
MEEMRLQKYLAECGVASRRGAEAMIAEGRVSVDGKVVTEMGVKVTGRERIAVDGRPVRPERNKIYIMINKPVGVLSAASDDRGRQCVVDLVEGIRERLYPVGRLDYDTSGLLLLTNDGELAKKLTHPSSEVSKLYHVVLDKPLTKNDMLRIADGIELDDGFIAADEIAYDEDDESKKGIGIQLHSGRNRIVRRIFEHLGYDVVKLDRVMFAGLDKYKLPRGEWRFLTDLEVVNLKKF